MNDFPCILPSYFSEVTFLVRLSGLIPPQKVKAIEKSKGQSIDPISYPPLKLAIPDKSKPHRHN